MQIITWQYWRWRVGGPKPDNPKSPEKRRGPPAQKPWCPYEDTETCVSMTVGLLARAGLHPEALPSCHRLLSGNKARTTRKLMPAKVRRRLLKAPDPQRSRGRDGRQGNAAALR